MCTWIIMIRCNWNWIIKVTSHYVSEVTNTGIWMIACIYSNITYEYKITRGSHTHTSFSNIDEHYFRGLIGIPLKMANILLSVKTNVLSLDGITLTNKSPLFPYSAWTNINSLPFVSILLGPYCFLMGGVQPHCDSVPAQWLGIWYIPKHCVLLGQKL